MTLPLQLLNKDEKLYFRQSSVYFYDSLFLPRTSIPTGLMLEINAFYFPYR